MNKLIRDNKQSFADFVDKVAAKWRLSMRPNTPSSVKEGESAEDILRDLIAMPTVTGNYEATREAFDYIDRFLSGHGMHVKRMEWNGIESLVATTKRTKTPTVFLAGHIDVVPAPAASFQLQERNGKYYGRGVLDMKGAVAGYLAVVQQLQDTIQEYDFGLMLMSDEEVGGFDGAKHLAEEGYLPKVMVLPDGGVDWNLEQFAKGMWHVTIEATGKSAHASRPWEGENAIDNLMHATQEIKALFPPPSLKTSTINVGVIQGGKAINQIPSFASASIDVRFASPEDQRQLIAQTLKIIKRRGIVIGTEVLADPIINDPKDPYLSKFAECTEAVIGRPVEWITSNANNDSRFFTKLGVPCATAYPPGGNHHGSAEWLSKKGFYQFQSIVLSFLEKAAKKPQPQRKAADKKAARHGRNLS
jgi:acetylornithine deacetylase/succinyl-diaminopimelate desuccinylase-like protein